jgi:hypothetical protein
MRVFLLALSSRNRKTRPGGAMTGRVVEINAPGGMIGIQTEAGGYSVVEILFADQAGVGDTIEWTGDAPLGRRGVRNLSKGVRFTAFFQCHGVTRENLNRELLLQP